MSGDKITNATLDAPTLSGRTQEIERLNEIQSPENRPDALASVTTFPQYFQMEDFSKFSAQAEYLADSGAGGLATAKIYAAWTGTDEATATYIDMTQALKWTLSGSAPAAVASVAINGPSGGTPIRGVWTDPEGHLCGAKWVKHEVDVTVVTNSDGTSELDKNTMVV